MSWLNKLAAKAAAQAVAEPAPLAPSLPTPPQPKTEPRQVTAIIRNASGSDPGEIAIGSYTVEGRLLKVLDENGKLVGQQDGDDPLMHLPDTEEGRDIVARNLLRQRRNGFNRRIDYPRLSIA